MRRPQPLVSILVVDRGEPGDTRRLLASLDSLAWPAGEHEVLVGAEAPEPAEGVRMVELPESLGLPAALDVVAGGARGELLAVIAADSRPDPAWLSAAVAVLRRDVTVGCVASKVLDWDGNRTRFSGAALSVDGRVLPGGQYPPGDWRDAERDCLFGDLAGLVVRRAVHERIGGFGLCPGPCGAGVDFGWRVWLSGSKVRYVPGSVVLQREHGPWDQLSADERDRLEATAGLFTAFTCWGDDLQGRAVAVAEMGRPDAASSLAAELGRLQGARQRVQAMRVRPDGELLRFFRVPEGEAGDAARALGFDEVLSGRRRVLVLTGDVLAERMAGPGIRAYQIARVLAAEHDVRLMSVEASELDHPAFSIGTVASDRQLRDALRWCDVAVVQGNLPRQLPVLARSDAVLVFDLYDPIHLEQLAQLQGRSPEVQEDTAASVVGLLEAELRRGDVFLCASRKQRDLWLGALSVVGRLNPRTYAGDPMFEGLVAVVPFGVNEDPPRRSGAGVRGIVPGVGPDDKVLLWGGGLYDWFDPITLIRAVEVVKDKVPEVRLVFLGTAHPNPKVGTMHVVAESRALADELGLTGRHVFFHDAWVPYDQRQNFLLDADVGVSTHHLHAETAFSFRTRVLDYLWAGLPIVTTEGDALADVVADRGLGLSVPPNDVEALATALVRLLTDDELVAGCRERIAVVADELRWDLVLEPLVAFCRSPRRAADVAPAQRSRPSRVPVALGGRLGADARTVEALYRAGGWPEVVDAAGGRVRRAGLQLRRRVGSNLRTLEAVQRQGGWSDVVRATLGRLRQTVARLFGSGVGE
jgi:glycosyltransferase involved in cell wall biosynthesis/GT2 family glycosyltransferase